MKNNLTLFWCFVGMLFLSGCLEEIKVNQDITPKTCFEITSISDGRPNSPILLDRCTGETWMLLRVDAPLEKGEIKPGYSWGWYRIEVWATENAIAPQ